ncbi:SDR family NAD(P)-dependent oxidoreductase [Streptomyces sp. NPDC004561]
MRDAGDRQLRGNVVVVTGAAGGMGSEIAAWLARFGARVYGIDVSAGGSSPDGVTTVSCDLTDPDAVRRIAAEVLGVTGRVDLPVNTAGLVSATRPMETIGDDELGPADGSRTASPERRWTSTAET